MCARLLPGSCWACAHAASLAHIGPRARRLPGSFWACAHAASLAHVGPTARRLPDSYWAYTRAVSLTQLMKLCTAMGGQADTIAGLAGIGDLMLTCFGDLSRNRTCGKRMVQVRWKGRSELLTSN